MFPGLSRSFARRVGHRAIVAGAITFAVVTFVAWHLIDRRALPARVELLTPRGSLWVEVANSPATRRAGLANRDALPSDGLLLEWDSPGKHPIWMAEMRFSLDLVWIDENGGVLAVLPNVPPCSRQPCPLYDPPSTDASIAVLEVAAGIAARHGLAPHTRMRRAGK